MNQEITIPTRDISRKIFWDRQVLLILEILLLAISYFGLAKLSLATAATPTLSAIWTPSGLAVAALMVRGFRIWPGILLGVMALRAQILVFESCAERSSQKLTCPNQSA